MSIEEWDKMTDNEKMMYCVGYVHAVCQHENFLDITQDERRAIIDRAEKIGAIEGLFYSLCDPRILQFTPKCYNCCNPFNWIEIYDKRKYQNLSELDWFEDPKLFTVPEE